MAKKFNQPLRMCVSCRDRQIQEKLLRLQCNDGSLEVFSGRGRSFYLCKDCILLEKKVLKALMRQCRGGDKNKFTNKLKEIITDDRKS
ncbi:MAG: DUF448 domain-containing protein [Epsilonproteobacteria bacterium]|nr:DUF448 domain-containing protein [Campylobacterota bacterium]